MNIFKRNKVPPAKTKFEEAINFVHKRGKNISVAAELFSHLTAIFPSKKMSLITGKILLYDLPRTETLALAAEFCKPAADPKELHLISEIYVYAGARYRKEAIYYLEQFIPHIFEYRDFPDGHVKNSDGVDVDQRKANISNVYANLGKCYEGEYEFDKALDAYKTAYKLTPYFPDLAISISKVLVKKNDLSSALDFMLTAKESTFYRGEFKEVLDRYIDDIQDKIQRGYVYKPRKKQ